MAVIELALLHNKSFDPNIDRRISSTLNTLLSHALTTLTHAANTNHPFTLLQEERVVPPVRQPPSTPPSPANIYILGAWRSVAAHDEFLPSQENQRILEQMRSHIDVRWMFHFDVVDCESARRAGVEGERADADRRVDAAGDVSRLMGLVGGELSGYVALERYFVPKGQRERVWRAWTRSWDVLAGKTVGKPIAGWRVGPVYGEEGTSDPPHDEFVVLSAWDDARRYIELVQSGVSDWHFEALKQIVTAKNVRVLSVCRLGG